MLDDIYYTWMIWEMKPTMTKLSAWSWMHPRNTTTTTTTTTNLDPNSSRWVWRPTNLKHTPSLSSWNSRCSNTIMTHVLSPPTSMSSGANHVPTNAFLTWSAPSSADGRPDWWLWRHTQWGINGPAPWVNLTICWMCFKRFELQRVWASST